MFPRSISHRFWTFSGTTASSTSKRETQSFHHSLCESSSPLRGTSNSSSHSKKKKKKKKNFFRVAAILNSLRYAQSGNEAPKISWSGWEGRLGRNVIFLREWNSPPLYSIKPSVMLACFCLGRPFAATLLPLESSRFVLRKDIAWWGIPFQTRSHWCVFL